MPHHAGTKQLQGYSRAAADDSMLGPLIMAGTLLLIILVSVVGSVVDYCITTPEQREARRYEARVRQFVRNPKGLWPTPTPWELEDLRRASTQPTETGDPK